VIRPWGQTQLTITELIMTDNENILNDSGLENQIPSTPLREAAIKFLIDIELAHDVLYKLETALNSPVHSIGISKIAIKRSLYQYPYTIPHEIINLSEEYKKLIEKEISDVAFILGQLESHKEYKEVHDGISKKEGE